MRPMQKMHVNDNNKLSSDHLARAEMKDDSADYLFCNILISLITTSRVYETLRTDWKIKGPLHFQLVPHTIKAVNSSSNQVAITALFLSKIKGCYGASMFLKMLAS